MPSRTPLLDERALGRTLARMASEIVERSRGTEDLVLVGIQRRGVELAGRLKRLIDSSEGSNLPVGKLDITLYRDDLQTIGPRPVVGENSLPDLGGRSGDQHQHRFRRPGGCVRERAGRPGRRGNCEREVAMNRLSTCLVI